MSRPDRSIVVWQFADFVPGASNGLSTCLAEAANTTEALGGLVASGESNWVATWSPDLALNGSLVPDYFSALLDRSGDEGYRIGQAVVGSQVDLQPLRDLSGRIKGSFGREFGKTLRWSSAGDPAPVVEQATGVGTINRWMPLGSQAARAEIATGTEFRGSPTVDSELETRTYFKATLTDGACA